MNTSVISPVASRVLTTLSPSPPCGRVSTLTVMSGFLAVNAFASASAGLSVCSELSTSHEIVTLPPSLAPVVVGLAETAAARRDHRTRERDDEPMEPHGRPPHVSSCRRKPLLETPINRARSASPFRTRPGGTSASTSVAAGASRYPFEPRRRLPLAADERELLRGGDDLAPGRLVVEHVAHRRRPGQRPVRRPEVRARATRASPWRTSTGSLAPGHVHDAPWRRPARDAQRQQAVGALPAPPRRRRRACAAAPRRGSGAASAPAGRAAVR